MWFSHQNGCFRKVNLKNDIKLKKKKKKKTLPSAKNKAVKKMINLLGVGQAISHL